MKNKIRFFCGWCKKMLFEKKRWERNAVLKERVYIRPCKGDKENVFWMLKKIFFVVAVKKKLKKKCCSKTTSIYHTMQGC
jgi:hypothetical protein